MSNQDNKNIPKDRKYSQATYVQFTPELFNQVLQDQGIRLKHFKTTACPNRTDINFESHNINCTLCDNAVIPSKSCSE